MRQQTYGGESGEKGPAKGNPVEQNNGRTQSREALQRELDRIRQKAAKDKSEQFTAIWRHVHRIDRLREAYLSWVRLFCDDPEKY